MKLQFARNQRYQLDVIASVTDLFDGQPQGAPSCSVIKVGEFGELFAGQERTELGIGDARCGKHHFEALGVPFSVAGAADGAEPAARLAEAAPGPSRILRMLRARAWQGAPRAVPHESAAAHERDYREPQQHADDRCHGRPRAVHALLRARHVPVERARDSEHAAHVALRPVDLRAVGVAVVAGHARRFHVPGRGAAQRGTAGDALAADEGTLRILAADCLSVRVR